MTRRKILCQFKSSNVNYLLSVCNVENILKGILDSVPSPSSSVKVQITGGKVCLWCKGKTLLGVVEITQRCFAQKYVDNAQQYFALLPQVNLLKSFLLYFYSKIS